MITIIFSIVSIHTFGKELKKPQKWELELEAIPNTVEAFRKMRDKVAQTPQGGVLMFIVALNMYAKNNSEGTKALVLAIDKRYLTLNRKSGMYKNHSIRNFFAFNKVRNKPYIARSYITSTSPQNNYAVGEAPYTVKMFTTAHSFYHKGRIRIMVSCSGADSERPITVKQNSKGIWKAYEYSTMILGIKDPVKKDNTDEDL